MPDFKPQQKIDGFLLQEPLGGGQDGEVWLAKRMSIGKRCAIKFLRSVEDADAIARFDREIRILAELDHPHIIQIQDKGEAWNPATEENVPYYVMEYVRADSLHSSIRQLPTEERFAAFCQLFGQVVSALHAAHGIDVSHGDVKAGNILVLAKERVAKLSDFGFGLLPGEAKEKRTAYPDSSYPAPPGLTPAQADVYRLGMTMTTASEEVSLEAPPAVTRDLRSLTQRMVRSAERVALGDVALALNRLRDAAVLHVTSQSVAKLAPEVAGTGEGVVVLPDPIYGQVVLTSRVRSVVDHPVFQRLRDVKMLPSCSLVYPAFTVSAFERAIGTHALVGQQLRVLVEDGDSGDLNPDVVNLVIAATLLSSTRRAPFEHALSHGGVWGKELVSAGFAQSVAWQELRDLIVRLFHVSGAALAGVVDPGQHGELDGEFRLAKSLLQGPLAAASIDCTRRYGSRAGFAGMTDISRLLNALVVSGDGELVIRESSLATALDLQRDKRELLERLVYHRSVRGADAMVAYGVEVLAAAGFDSSELITLDDSAFLTRCREEANQRSVRAAETLFERYARRVLHKPLLALDLGPWIVNWSNQAARVLQEDISARISAACRGPIEAGEVIVDGPVTLRNPDILVVDDDGELRGSGPLDAMLQAVSSTATFGSAMVYAAPEVLTRLSWDDHAVRQYLSEDIRTVTNAIFPASQ